MHYSHSVHRCSFVRVRLEEWSHHVEREEEKLNAGHLIDLAVVSWMQVVVSLVQAVVRWVQQAVPVVPGMVSHDLDRI